MNSFAEEGSASREMLDLEFENLQNDQVAQQRIVNQKSTIWSEFVSYIRDEIKQNQEFKSDFEVLVFDWIEQLQSAA
jgi:hypothetical protein